MTQPRELAEKILEMQGVNIVEILGTLAEATEVIKQLADATAAVEWAYPVPDDVQNEGACPSCFAGKPTRIILDSQRTHMQDCELDAQLTKARAFLDRLK